VENRAHVVDRIIRDNPSAPAVVEFDRKGAERRVDYAEFGRLTSGLAVGLSRAGVGKGDRVLILIPMGLDLYVSIMAIMRLGAVCVFVDPYMGAKRFDACCASVRPKAFIGAPKGHLFFLLCPELRKVSIRIATHGLPRWLAVDLRRLIERNSGTGMAPAEVIGSDSALITFTTGSSGAPKGSNRTHDFLRAQMEALELPARQGCASDFPGFPILPLDNLARGLLTYVPAFKSGKVRDADGEAILNQALAWRPEMMSGSPAYLESLADKALSGSRRLDSVRNLFTGGAPITARALEKLAKAWPKASILIVYGSTEVEPVSSIAASEILGECRARAAKGYGFCVGRPVASLEVIILPLAFKAGDAESLFRQEPAAGSLSGQTPTAGSLSAFALPAGKAGEIVVRGPHVNTGYWNNPEGEAANKIRTPQGIWHRMGDAGYFDGEGRLWVVGRVHAAMANPRASSAESVPEASGNPMAWPFLFPYQAECIADETPGVKKSAYLEANGGFWLAVEALSGSEVAGIEAALRRALEGFPLGGIRFIPRLPMDPRHNSKVEYATLRKWLEKRS
jgi:acyl-CoA synthetase (AMP-forming)/AMP-acid ligase II